VAVVGGSLWENLLLGLEAEGVPKEEVEETCRAAVVHEFAKWQDPSRRVSWECGCWLEWWSKAAVGISKG
jgi:hypothetical protein